MRKKGKYRPRRDYRHYATEKAGVVYEPYLRRKPGAYRPRMTILETWLCVGRTIKFPA